jgi:phosphopantothenoylcysteine decarboxylase
VPADQNPDGVEITRDALTTRAKADFDNTYATLADRLMASKDLDGSFVQRVTEDTAKLGAPLLHEKIETTSTRDGKRKTEIVEIGKRVAMFKKFVEKEEGKLNEFWKHWDEVQNEYIELGIEVFGLEAFDGSAAGLKIRQKDFKREMDLLNLEHNARIEELDEEIEDISPRILQKMKTSEKVWN